MNYRVFELDAHTWRIEEYDETSSVYLYLLEGEQSALLLDTGLGQIDLRKLVAGLTQLPVQVLNTHAHFDHIGGNGLFDRVMRCTDFTPVRNCWRSFPNTISLPPALESTGSTAPIPFHSAGAPWS